MSDENTSLILVELRGLSAQIDEIKEKRYENGIKATEMDGRVKMVEKFVESHTYDHKEDRRFWRSLNLRVWLMIGGGFVGLVYGIIQGVL